MQMQWVILLIGLATVFSGLFIIMLIIMLFKVTLAPKGIGGRASPQPATPLAQPQATAGLDPVLVAVITAAIAAASGRPASSFRIASVEADGFNTPAWGYIDRVARNLRGHL